MSVSLWLEAWTLTRQIEGLLVEHTREWGLSVIEMHVLRALYEQDGRHASDVARAVDRPPGGFTPVLDRLESAGLIARQPDPQDRRAVRIQLLPAGEHLRAPIMAAFAEAEPHLQAAFEEFSRRVVATRVHQVRAETPMY